MSHATSSHSQLSVEKTDVGEESSESTVTFPDADTFVITEQKEGGEATMTFKRK